MYEYNFRKKVLYNFQTFSNAVRLGYEKSIKSKQKCLKTQINTQSLKWSKIKQFSFDFYLNITVYCNPYNSSR